MKIDGHEVEFLGGMKWADVWNEKQKAGCDPKCV